jgi:hypothetical protein
MVRLRQFVRLDDANPHRFPSELRKFEDTVAASDTAL